MPKFISLVLCFFGLLITLAFNACSKTDQQQPEQTVQSNSSFFFTTMTNLVIDVAYEPSAAPFDGNTNSGKPLWQLLDDNLKALFSNRSVGIVVPKTLSQMSVLPAQNKATWNASEVVALALQHQKMPASATEARFQILFLSGYAADENGAPNKTIIGFQVTGTQIVVMFKEVIRASSANPNGTVAKYVEQSTLIHEMGHAIGLVDNGVPLTSAHADSAHGAHCTNKSCVMHYLNEGASDMVGFVQTYITSGSNVMFGAECLNDTQNFR